MTGSSTDALVLDAHMRQALAALRALGRSGLKVASAESVGACDPRQGVPAFRSRWSAWHATLPDFRHDPDAYGAFVFDLARDNKTTVVIPSSDGSIAALRPWRARFEQLGVVLPLASEAALDVANDKRRTLDVATQLGVACPVSVPLSRPDDARDVLATVGYPAVIKPASSWVRSNGSSAQVRSQEVLNESEGLAFVERLAEMGMAAIVQNWVGGAREAVSFLYADDRVWAEFAQVAYRTSPVLGGVSVVRESIPMPEVLRSAALQLVRALDLEGYCEVEFRRDAAGRPLLMEINARLSGSLEVAIRSGVDFPNLVWRWAVGEQLSPVPGYRTGVRIRWLHGDIQWLMESLANPGRPDSVPRRHALGMFLKEFFQHDGYDDLDRGDVRPTMSALRWDVTKARRKVTNWVKPSPRSRPSGECERTPHG